MPFLDKTFKNVYASIIFLQSASTPTDRIFCDSMLLSKSNAAEKISELEKKIDSLYVEKQSEGGLLLEIEHLKDDNLRLLQMLKSTNEFKDFAYLSETEAGGVRFCKPASAKKAATPSATSAKGKGIPNSKKDILDIKNPPISERIYLYSLYH